jgi:hypothetical protein
MFFTNSDDIVTREDKSAIGNNEFAHLLMPARLPISVIVGFVGRAIVALLAFLPTLTEALERGTPAV